MLKLILLAVAAVISSASAQFSFADEVEEPVPRSCHLPAGVPALCVPLAQCAHVSELVSNLQKPLPGDVALLIRDSFFCEAVNKGDPTEVCCPVEGIAPPPLEEPKVEALDSCTLQNKDFDASCAVYSRCSPFAQLLSNLRRPFPKEIPDLMRRGWLCGFESVGGVALPKVCCPTDALTVEATTKPPTTPAPTTEATTEPNDDRVATTPEPLNFFRHKNRGQLAPSKSCGVSLIKQEERIVGGQDADLGQFPWLANLGYSINGGEVSFKCGGSLVGAKYVLTAAHCVTNLPGSYELVRIRLGEHKLSEANPDCTKKPFAEEICSVPLQEFNIEKIIHHESYNAPNPFQNDIALIKLDKPAVFNDYIQPICLPFNDDEDEQYQLPNDPASARILTAVAGWGATNERGRDPADVLQFLDVNVTEPEECKEVYRTRGGRLTVGQQMCAGGRKGKDSCVGDSGSALMREVGEVESAHWKLLGVVSFGPRLCGTEGIPGVYTRTRFYLDWILNNAEP